MPNWCENRLSVTGPEADVSALMGRVVVEDPSPERGRYDPPMVLDYAALVPEPPYTPDPDALSGTPAAVPDWYAWRLQHWGVKWNHPGLSTLEVLTHGDFGELVAEFDTPWGPPLPFMEALAREYPALSLRLHYEEQGNDVHGVWKAGPEDPEEV